jgi:hypothetical protein
MFAYSLSMGGERSSTTRQRLAGKICALCHRLLDSTPRSAGERVCDQCAGSRCVYMTFFERHGWIVVQQAPECKFSAALNLINK